MINKIKQKGATFVELVLAMVIIGIAVTAMLSAYRTTVINSADPMTRKQAVLISESLMEEVLSKSFTKPTGGFSGPFTVANRSRFDTVSDYNGFAMTGISNIAGTPIAELSAYNATVSIANTALAGIAAPDSILVTIDITGLNDTFTLKGYRINYE